MPEEYQPTRVLTTDLKNPSVWTPIEEVVVGGTPGPEGPQGPQGEQGAQGIQGEQGVQGPPGAKGDTGNTGSQGSKGDKGDTGDAGAQGEQGIQGIQGIQGVQGEQGPQGEPGASGLGYTLSIQALTSSPADSATVYFGQLPKAPTTTANISKVYVRKAGTIKMAQVYCYSGTAGTAEAWSLYIRKNNSADTLIATLSVSVSERVFTNSNLDITMSAGDYFEIKGVQPAWATNPLTCIYGGYVYIE